MRILIDTHAFIWFFSDPPRLSTTAIELIEDNTSMTLISIVSLWEISIKNSSGKLGIADGFESILDVLSDNEIGILPIDFSHTLKQNKLPFHHRDPFDRMIAAQAIVESIDLISIDDAFDPYFADSEVKRIW